MSEHAFAFGDIVRVRARQSTATSRLYDKEGMVALVNDISRERPYYVVPTDGGVGELFTADELILVASGVRDHWHRDGGDCPWCPPVALFCANCGTQVEQSTAYEYLHTTGNYACPGNPGTYAVPAASPTAGE